VKYGQLLRPRVGREEEGVVAEYICIDGPLEGRSFRWRKAPRAGEPVTVAVVDVDHAVLEVDYRVPAAAPLGSGRLEFVAARDAHLRGTTSILARVRGAGSRVVRHRRIPLAH
jgi:hypothetical protein